LSFSFFLSWYSVCISPEFNPAPVIDSIRPNPLVIFGPPLPVAFAANKSRGGTASNNENLPPVMAGERSRVPAQDIAPSITLAPNAPNPFDERTTISYALPDKSGESTVQLEVVDMFGRVVAELVPQKRQAAGSYKVEWNTARAATGVYYAVLRVASTNGSIQRRVVRMTLVR
jgi:hypothetical protein